MSTSQEATLAAGGQALSPQVLEDNWAGWGAGSGSRNMVGDSYDETVTGHWVSITSPP